MYSGLCNAIIFEQFYFFNNLNSEKKFNFLNTEIQDVFNKLQLTVWGDLCLQLDETPSYNSSVICEWTFSNEMNRSQSL